MLPLSGIVELRAEELVDLLPLYFVDIVAYGRTLPQHTVGGDASHTGIVVVAKTLPQRAAIGETVVPSHMMEPQQILFRASLHVFIERTVRLTILCRGS